MPNDIVKKSADVVGIAVSGLELIAKLTSNTTDDKAVAILASVRAVLATVAQGSEGKLTFAECHARLRELRASLETNDVGADLRLDEKFDPEV